MRGEEMAPVNVAEGRRTEDSKDPNLQDQLLFGVGDVTGAGTSVSGRMIREIYLAGCCEDLLEREELSSKSVGKGI